MNSWDLTTVPAFFVKVLHIVLSKVKFTGKNISAEPLSTKYVSKSNFSLLFYPFLDTIGAPTPGIELIRLSKSLIIKWLFGMFLEVYFRRLYKKVGKKTSLLP
jgi:hypothetical protein